MDNYHTTNTVHCTEEELFARITNMGYVQVEGDPNRYIRRNANGIHTIVIHHEGE